MATTSAFRSDRLVRYAAAALGALALWTGSTAIVSAQSTLGDSTSDAFNDLRQDNERDPLLGGSDIDMMDLIHRANLSGGRSLAEYISGQSAQIQNAASDFRALQLQRIHQSQAIATPDAVSLELSE